MASRRFIPWCSSATSASWRPMRWVGLSEVIGSWNTIASDVPSIRRRRGRGAAQVVAEELQPSAVTSPGRSISWATASAVRLFPEPDSPTTPTASPRRMVKLTPRTGVTGSPPAREADPQALHGEHHPILADPGGRAPSSMISPDGAGAPAARVARPTAPGVVRSPIAAATASPKRLKPRPAMTTAALGTSAVTGSM
jgi:hypothetical protein